MKHILFLLLVLFSINGCTPVTHGALPNRTMVRNHTKAVHHYHRVQRKHRWLR